MRALGPRRDERRLRLPPEMQGQVFNFAALLEGRASSAHTARAYFRWVDRYLGDMAGLRPVSGPTRQMRMSALPVPALIESISPTQLRAWLGRLQSEGQGKQGITQAKAAITTLASLLAEAGLLDDYTSASLKNVRPPRAEEGQRTGRWLSASQLKELIGASRRMASSDNQELRNQVALSMLCTMALRREELAAARWEDLSIQNDRAVLRVHGKGRKTAVIDVPGPVLMLLSRWREAIIASNASPTPRSALIRRIWKGGRISRGGLTADGVWLLVAEAAHQARLGHVAPHDLRRSVAGALQEAGTSVEMISRLLRHSNVAVTERYLSRLPQPNEGAVVMSDLIGLGSE